MRQEDLDPSKFTPLHVHNSFSFKDGIGTPQSRVKWAKDNGKTAVSTSNHGNISDWIQIYTECQKHGIKPILGCEFYFHRTAHLLEPALLEQTEENGKIKQLYKKVNHVTMFAKTLTGYYNMLKIHNEAWMKRYYYRPIVSAESVKEHHEGIIALSGCSNSEINKLIATKHSLTSDEHKQEVTNTIELKVKSLGHLYKGKLKSVEDSGLDEEDYAYKEEHEKFIPKEYRSWLEQKNAERDGEFLITVDAKIESYIDWWNEMFAGNFYIELMPIDFAIQKKINEELIVWAKKKNIPTVITTDSHYLEQKEAEIQEMQMLSDQKRTFNELKNDTTGKIWTIKSNDLYYKTVDEIYQSFLTGHKSDVFTEEVFWQSMINVTKLTDSVENYTIDTSSKMPVLYSNGFDILMGKIKEGKKRLGVTKETMSPEQYTIYNNRIVQELKVIKDKNYTDYFLIVEDMIRHAKDTFGEWTVGPGRGCFAPNSPVHMADGEIKNIRDIVAGEKVITATGKDRTVLSVFSYKTSENMCLIRIGEPSIICTKDHKLWVIRQDNERVVKNAEWVEAKDITIGDYLISVLDGSFTPVTYIGGMDYSGMVYDLSVDEDPSYNIGGFAVHNSAAGSLVNYLIGITNVDPLKHQLLFERFLDPSRDDPPDIDCLHEFTPVLMKNRSFKLIKDIKVGDMVIDHKGDVQEVLNWSTRVAKPDKEQMYEVFVVCGSETGSFIAPGHHRMIDRKGNIVYVDNLKKDAGIAAPGYGFATVVSIMLLNVPYDEIRLVDIQVSNSETFQILPFKAKDYSIWGLIEKEYEKSYQS
jgi:hypothetical protein